MEERGQIKEKAMVFCTALDIFDHSTSEAIFQFSFSKGPLRYIAVAG
jgi:hypothetical protein